MTPAAIVLVALALWSPAATPGAPYYTAASIANSAASVAGLYAPNTFVTIYGQNLAYVTVAISSDDIHGGMLPTSLIGTGVTVLINNLGAAIYYVSPGQINVLIPANLAAGPATLQLEVDGLAGPAVTIMLGATAPAMFQLDAVTVLATHADYSLVTAAAPAQPGEEIVLYATGLGTTIPPAEYNQLPPSAAPLAAGVNFQVLLNGSPVDPRDILYAGAAPGFAGLYQINLILPANTPPNPEIQIGTSAQLSPPSRFLPVQ
jgi:uncharacterized protein (TIGR03437 family)